MATIATRGVTGILAKSKKISLNALGVIGETPLVLLNRVSANCKATVLCKLESQNPGFSVKDRIAAAMIQKAEEAGAIEAGKTVLVEPTSGNTGIGLAMAAAAKGYKLILTMPATMSLERRAILMAFGAEVRLTPGPAGMPGAIAEAKNIAESIESSWSPMQFDNPANPQVHYETTGPEIWRDTNGNVDWFVAGVGTGGTISGAGKYLKEQKPSLRTLAVEPTESSVMQGGDMGPHKIQGIGAGFLPGVLGMDHVDEIASVSSEDSIAMAKRVAREEGLLVGISSGAAIKAAVDLGERDGMEGKMIVVIAPDSGERYISSVLFEDIKAEAEALPILGE